MRFADLGGLARRRAEWANRSVRAHESKIGDGAVRPRPWSGVEIVVQWNDVKGQLRLTAESTRVPPVEEGRVFLRVGEIEKGLDHFPPKPDEETIESKLAELEREWPPFDSGFTPEQKRGGTLHVVPVGEGVAETESVVLSMHNAPCYAEWNHTFPLLTLTPTEEIVRMRAMEKGIDDKVWRPQKVARKAKPTNVTLVHNRIFLKQPRGLPYGDHDPAPTYGFPGAPGAVDRPPGAPRFATASAVHTRRFARHAGDRPPRGQRTPASSRVMPAPD